MRAYHRLIVATFLALATPAFAQTPTGQITVTGEGVVYATPDMATLSLGVTTTAKSANAAMVENAAQMTKVLENLKAAGIEPRDLHTSNLSLQPNWTNSGPKSENVIDGYTALNQLTVRLRELNSLGTTIDAALKDGVNTLNAVQFAVANPGPLLEQARMRAVVDAHARADIFATSARVNLGPILSITEGGSNSPQPQYARSMMESVPVEAGEITLSASVTIVWQIAD